MRDGVGKAGHRQEKQQDQYSSPEESNNQPLFHLCSRRDSNQPGQTTSVSTGASRSCPAGMRAESKPMRQKAAQMTRRNMSTRRGWATGRQRRRRGSTRRRENEGKREERVVLLAVMTLVRRESLLLCYRHKQREVTVCLNSISAEQENKPREKHSCPP